MTPNLQFEFLGKNPYRDVELYGEDFGFLGYIPIGYSGVVLCDGDFDFPIKKIRIGMLCSGVGTLRFHGKIPIGVLCPVLGTLIFFSKNPYREKIPVLGTLIFFDQKSL